MGEDKRQIPIQPVDKPVICSPYDEPHDHWIYDSQTGDASRAGFRRPASYWYKTEKTGSAQQSLFAEEERDDLPLVNVLRQDVKRWREADYRGASHVTKELLRWWANPMRGRRLFFCQREAVETVIYLAEMRMPKKSGRTGFKNFALSDENLARMQRGERPTGEGFDLASKDFFPRLLDVPIDAGLMPLLRLGCKMATGSGKTVVMAMLISWAFCNRGVNPSSKEYPNAVLVCCPNLTVKERLQVLRPDCPENYYAAFDLVPVNLRPHLQSGKVLVENWHRFSPESEHKEGDKSYAVVNKGPETPETLARRVLGDLYDRLPIMVLNDEGHHCWRPAPSPIEEDAEVPKRGRKKDGITAEEKAALEDEAAEARVWLQGLDWINNCLGKDRPGISMAVDMSATPFSIKGSGYPEGQPFPWLVSDFGLVDAIESGIVKIPRLPVSDTAGKKDDAGRPDPKYFRLWANISNTLQPSEKYGSGKPKPDACYREAEGALKQIAGQWLERFKYIQQATPDQDRVPPVLIIVCDNTEIADYFYRKISGESENESVTLQDIEEVLEGSEEGTDEEEEAPKGKKSKPKKQIIYGASVILPEFANTPTRRYALRIDNKVLAEAESQDPAKNKQKAAEELRRVVATVGRIGEPGEHVRCVVSVAMLTEGWDANNVTHILGIRAFGSQLLCEQVVGRGLRRMNYEPEWDEQEKRELLKPEYVDVYGIPFSVIPFKGRPTNQAAPEDKPKYRVWAVPEREEMAIRFPIVEGYVFQTTKGLLRCNVDAVEPLAIDPVNLEPTATFLRPTAGYLDAQRMAVTPFEYVKQDRTAYYGATHLQTILFQITQKIIDDLLAPSMANTDKKSRVLRLQSRHLLFPQVFSYVQSYVRRKVTLNGVDPRELGLEKYSKLIVERLRDAIYPDDSAGEPPLLPILNRYRPYGSTSGVDFVTTRPTSPTTKSHINSVVQHSTWEADAAKLLDACDFVTFFARNDHLGLMVKYEYMGVDHDYEPDFLVRLSNGVTVVLEIKGYEIHNPEQVNSKHNAAKKWVRAVNNLADFGRWDFLVCRNLDDLIPCLQSILTSAGRTEMPSPMPFELRA